MEEIESSIDRNSGSPVAESYGCNDCLAVFMEKELLIQHLETHNPKRNHICQGCEKHFQSSYQQRYHNCIRKFKCNFCGDILESLSKRKIHEQDHRDAQNGHICSECGEKFLQKLNLDQHYKSKHMNHIQEFNCSQCLKKFKFKSRLDFHFKSVHTTKKDHSCQDCGILLKNSRSLKQHRILKHPTMNIRRKCISCDAMVPIHGLKKHMEDHKAVSNKIPFVCGECNESFPTLASLDNHEKNRHLKCKSCSSMFTSRFTHKKHELLIHGDEKGAQICCICPKKFTSPLEQKRHVVSHSLLRLIKCELCESKFKTVQTLNQHKLMKHWDQKWFPCDKCKWSFKRSCDLLRHQKTHMPKEAYYNCEICDKKFEYLGNKNKHEKKHYNF